MISDRRTKSKDIVIGIDNPGVRRSRSSNFDVMIIPIIIPINADIVLNTPKAKSTLEINALYNIRSPIPTSVYLPI